MNIKEILNPESEVIQLEIDAPSLDQAEVLATEWCEEHNCLVNSIAQNEKIFIAEISSDDYS